jgi:hypothetical protein
VVPVLLLLAIAVGLEEAGVDLVYAISTHAGSSIGPKNRGAEALR